MGRKRNALYLLIWSAPTIITVLTALLLMVKQKKNVLVDIELIANQISFSIQAGTEEMKHRSITSVPAKSIVLANFRRVTFSADGIRYDDKTLPVNGEVVIQRWEDALWPPELRFSGEDIHLVQLDIGIGSKVTFHRSECDVAVDIEAGDELSKGTVSLGNSFTIRMERCDLINKEGSTIISRDENTGQRDLEIFSSFGQASSFLGDNSEGFHILLEVPEKDTRLLFSIARDDYGVFHVTREAAEEDVTLFSNTLIREIDFNYYDVAHGETSTVRSGKVEFRNIKKESISIEPGDFVHISQRGALKVVRLWLSPKDDTLGILLCGSIDSFELGKYFPIEQLPSLLEWLASDKRSHIIAAVLGWAIAQTLAIMSLITEVRKRAD